MLGRLRPIVAATLVASLATSTLPLTALAAPKAGISAEDRKKAIELFKEGQAFEDQGKWDQALEKFEGVGQIVMTPGTRFNIALCKENLGRLLEALDDYEAADRDAKAEKKPDIEKKARAAADGLKDRIPKLVLKVPSAVEGISITVDGKPIDPQNPELSVDPGKHKVEANADKRVPFSADVTVAEKESKEVVIRLPEQPKEEPPEPPPPEPPKEVATSRPIPMTALIVGGVGVASLLGSGLFYILRGSAKSTLDSNCNATTMVCPPDQQGTIDSGKRYTTLGNVFLVVGVVGVGAGVVLWATAPKKTVVASETEAPKPPSTEPPSSEPPPEPAKEPTPEPSASLRLVPFAPGADLGGIALRATF